MKEHHRIGRQTSWMWLRRILTIGAAFGIRTLTVLAQGVWRDEVDQWRFALQPLSEIIRNFTRAGWNGPLYSPLLRGWIALAGESVFAMRMLSVFWGVWIVALIVALARRMTGSRRVGGIAGLLAATSPVFVWYAQEIKMYSWVPMLVLLALYATDRACATGRSGWWAAAWVCATMAFYSHILAALLVPVLVLWFLLHPERHPSAWVGGLRVLLGLTLPYLPLVVWQGRLAFQERETGFPDRTFSQMVADLATQWGWGITQGPWDARRYAPLVTILVLVALMLLGLAVWIWRRRARRVGQLGVWLGLPLLAVWLISQRGSIFTERYLLWTAPAFLIGLAMGVTGIAARFKALGSGLLALILVLQMHGVLAQTVRPIKPEFEAAVAVVEARRESGEVLVFQIPYNHHVYAFYAGEPLDPWREAPYTNWPGAGEEVEYLKEMPYVDEKMRDDLGAVDGVWLIYSEVALWDDRELVKAWLDVHYRQVGAWHFHGVSVFHYHR